MKILIAMNSFKGSLSATEASDVVERAAFETGFIKKNTFKVPMVDGGTDSLEVWSNFLEVNPTKITTVDPLKNPLETTILIDKKNSKAYIEMAKASGLHLIEASLKTLFKATSYGTGVLILKAIDKGAKDIFLGIGGSATHDLGTGILRALGVKFYNKDKEELETPEELFYLDSIDYSSLDNLPKDLKITFLCDVNNRLLGSNGAAYTYAEQKGAVTEGLIKKCEKLSEILFKHFKRNYNIEIGNKDGDGAAGGLPSIIRVLINAELRSGASFLYDIVNLDNIMEEVSLVITGEGAFDSQSYFGKGPGYLIGKAKEFNKHTLVLSGKIESEVYEKELKNISFLSINNSLESIDKAIKYTERNLFYTTKNTLNLYKAGLKTKEAAN